MKCFPQAVGFLLLSVFSGINGLLYPPASSMSMVSSVSVPVVEYFPERRILIDWCFVMTFALPSEVSSFYNIPIWPGFRNPKARRRSPEYLDRELATIETKNSIESFKKYDRKRDGNRHHRDFSAGELYQGIEDFFVSYGFHETCILRSVCELARHPFDDRHQNILTDIITFLLTPSLHEGFDSTEHVYRETYGDAELRGFLGEDCARLYVECEKDFIGLVTKVIYD